MNIYLVVNAYKNRDNLSHLQAQDARTWIGFTQNQDELKEKQGVVDTWLVLAKQVTEEDNLTVERYWLHGVESGSYALILQFLFRGQGSELSLTPGMYVQAELILSICIAAAGNYQTPNFRKGSFAKKGVCALAANRRERNFSQC